jgi:hypothetical protein
MYFWTILLAILFATPALAQEGIWEDSLPLDGVGGDTDTGPVPDCADNEHQDGDGTCLARTGLGAQIVVAPSAGTSGYCAEWDVNGSIVDSGEACVVAGDISGSYLPLTGGTLDTDGHLTVMGRLQVHDNTQPTVLNDLDTVPDVSGASIFQTGTSANTIYNFGASAGTTITGQSDGGSHVIINHPSDTSLSEGDLVTIGGTINYNGVYEATTVTEFAFRIVHDWVGNDGAIGEWAAATTEAGHIIHIHSKGKITFQCAATSEESNALSCGSRNIATKSGDVTTWVGHWINLTSRVQWTLQNITRIDQSYAGYFIDDLDARTTSTTSLADTSLYGYLDLGFPEYFALDDTTPNVQQGTLFYSWECDDNYNYACVDVFDNRVGSPCNGSDIQCTGTADGLCDYDGTTDATSGQQRALFMDNVALYADSVTESGVKTRVRVWSHGFSNGDSVTITGSDNYSGTYTISNVVTDDFDITFVYVGNNAVDHPSFVQLNEVDSICDADGTTGHPAAAPGLVTITDFDGGVDGQWIVIVSQDQDIEFDCSANPNFDCGDADIPDITGKPAPWPSTTQWVYDGLEEIWRLIAFEEFSDVSKVQLRGDNTITGDNIHQGTLNFDTADVTWDDAISATFGTASDATIQ